MTEGHSIKRGNRFKDITGQRFGMLVAAEPLPPNGNATLWKYLCDCGTTKILKPWDARHNGHCGCQCRRTTGLVHTPTQWSYICMMGRCYDPDWAYYKYYGGRGIQVCERWRLSYNAFREDVGERPEGMTLDRYPDNNGNYEPGNVRWATPKQQANRRRNSVLITAFGRTQTLAQWAEEKSMTWGMLSCRLEYMEPEAALTAPRGKTRPPTKRRRKLSPDAVRDIKERLARGESLTAIVAIHNILPGTVRRIELGKQYAKM